MIDWLIKHPACLTGGLKREKYTMPRSIFYSHIAVAIVTFSMVSSAFADIVITGTRFVYQEKEREVTVKIDNVGEKPALAQVWIDAGDPNATPETAKAPFTITPPINRINGGKGQTLRMIYTGESLPANKESLFWLNVLEIPATKKDNKNQLKMAVRSRIKIFYRPQGLTGSANQAGKSIIWKKVNGGVEGSNPTPYFVSLANITEDKDGKIVVANGGMIAPGEKSVFPMKKHLETIYPSYISDEGAINSLAQQVIP
ncbi:molecular chaperone [Klebsiella oxytoca]|uniref:fimbrial biogenesis chaperone n=1 Tax=Klebsiella sp. RHBSTW-00465 TaxID=2742650 RepID=UPI001E398932|nr:fimbria/pilus periplasmic chaperone [Klebsiella sp. RHBSTW-00465]